MKSKNLCVTGLGFFVVSYIYISQGSLSAQQHIDFAHWFNLIGAVLLLSFNNVFPKNKLNSLASILTALGVIAHIGLFTIDFIMWSFGNDDVGRNALSEQISNTPLILYPFVMVGPSLLFVGLSYFIWDNGILMLNSCVVFAIGLALLLYRKEIQDLRK